jgi:hypothetical protein
MDTTKNTIIIKRKICPNGTRKNKNGQCEQVNLELLREEKKKPLVIESGDDIKGKAVKTLIIRDSQPIPKINDALASVPNNTNEFLRKKEQIEYAEEKKEGNEHAFLYPTLNDPNFSKKIAQHQEFFDTQYDGNIHDISKYADKMCDEPFELMPHQLFVKNFLSFQTPYNSLLLYHGLGSGKTCSAIGISEEMRQYMKQVGIKQRIIIVAAPNVQANFKLQLFDERQLKEEDGIWNIRSCVGDVFLREINPTNLKGISREKVISQIKSIINQYYVFMGYVELANYIRKKTMVQMSGFTDEEIRRVEIQNMRNFFNNRLIIVDEVHNIRLSEDNKDDKIGKMMMKLARHCSNMRLLLLSATPLYNSHNEIIWLTNLMNSNDKRGMISASEVFDQQGQFKKESKDQDGTIIDEGGYNLLSRKLTGYVSYVRGENPYVFPYRIYPNDFAVDKIFSQSATGMVQGILDTVNPSTGLKLPTIQMNGKKIDNPLSYLPVYVNEIGTYQEKAYKLLIKAMRDDIKKGVKNIEFDELDKFGFRQLQAPIEALNMVYPSITLDEQFEKGIVSTQTPETSEYDPRATMVGKRGMRTVMNYTDDSMKKIPRKYLFSYKPEVQEKYGRIFSPEKIGEYSAKISSIIQTIKKSKGIVLIYSQYIDGGVVPMALALEELGLTRYGSSPNTTPLFETPPVEPIDSLTLKPKSQVANFKPAQYVMITGDKSFSPNNAQDIKTITDENNKNGEVVKVILISKAGSEGLDFKCIRQIHILEPWYNLNRIEQIIGRGVRQKSHCLLPFNERNVEIYLHSTVLKTSPDEEAVDIYVYRLAKNKAEKIGRVTRLMKETAVDCLLNIGQTNFTSSKLESVVENRNIQLILSTDAKKIVFKIGDKPHTDVCDYMADCSFKCNKKDDKIDTSKVSKNMYAENFLQSNNQHIMKRIRDMYRDKDNGKHFYNLNEIIETINAIKQYPIAQIFSALSVFINNKTEYIIDQYGRRGNLINKGDIYAFQPVEINDESITVFERKIPIDFKRKSITMEISKDFINTEESIIQDTNTYDTIIRMIELNVKYAKSEQSVTRGDQNWYKHASKVLNHLQLIHEITYNEYVEFIIQHNIDMLMPEEKLIIISHMYSHIRRDGDLSETEQIIKTYIDKQLLTYNKKSGFIIQTISGWELYIQSQDDPSKWELAQPEDRRNFEVSNSISQTMSKDSSTFSDIVGFIDMFRNEKEMVFRIKDLSLMQNNTGTRISGQTPGKGDVIKRLNFIVYDGAIPDKPMYSVVKSKEIMQLGLCVILELLIRYRTSKKYKNKIWYLNPSESMYNKIAKFRRSA